MLYLVQHGEALTKEQDSDRPLSAHGESDVTRMAEFLVTAGVDVERVVHSGKTRAKQTATIFARFLSEHGKIEAVEGTNPNDSVEAFAQRLTGWATPTIVVGHLPFMAKLVTYLLTQRSEPVVITYQPGSVVCLNRDDHDCWGIQWMIRPDLLAKRTI